MTEHLAAIACRQRHPALSVTCRDCKTLPSDVVLGYVIGEWADEDDEGMPSQNAISRLAIHLAALLPPPRYILPAEARYCTPMGMGGDCSRGAACRCAELGDGVWTS